MGKGETSDGEVREQTSDMILKPEEVPAVEWAYEKPEKVEDLD